MLHNDGAVSGARTDDMPDPEHLRGMAMVLAELVRMDGADLVRTLCDRWELTLADFERARVDESDLEEIRRALIPAAAS